MARLSIALLGPFQIHRDGVPLSLYYEKVYALLAYLAMERGMAHSREALATLLWPEAPEASSRRSLSQALFSLRQSLQDDDPRQPWLLATRNTLQFNPASDFTLDTLDFSTLLDGCDTHAHADGLTCAVCADSRRQAAELYRGEFLQQSSVADSADYENWILIRREQFHRRALEALLQLADYHLRRGEGAAAARLASRQLELDPWREEAHRQLMRAYLLDGQRSAALAQYETCRRVLADELGVEPSGETRTLYEQIRADKAAPAPPPAPARPAAALRANLPARLTAFVGREHELELLAELIADPACRLLTLVGPGGIGKTRLAIEAGVRHREAFAQGAVFVPLAGVTAPNLLAEALAAALGLTLWGSDEPRAQVLNYLQDKQAVLILDNLEHLAGDEALVEWLRDLLDRGLGLKLVATSRQPLQLEGEWVLEVPGLEVQPAGGEPFAAAAELFVQSARRTRVGFSPSPADTAAVMRICQLVDGMPLAIELAAAWVRVLSPAEIADEIERDIGFLATSAPTVAERHRSMQAVFDQSWQLLSEAERAALEKLAVFRGGFGREAAEQLAGASLRLLSVLMSRSLVQRVAQGRYTLHELVRQYGTEKLRSAGQLDAARQKHLAYFLELAETAEHELKGRRQLEWVRQLEVEHDNLRAALDWALASDETGEAGLRLTGALPWFWYMRGQFHEGRDWLAEALQRRPQARTGTRAKALVAMGRMVNAAGEHGHACELAEESVRICREIGDSPGLANALSLLGVAQRWQGKTAEGLDHFAEALVLYRQAGDRWNAARILFNHGAFLGDFEGSRQGRAMLEESAALLAETGDSFLSAQTHIALGIIAGSAGDYSQAKAHLEYSLSLAREMRYPWGITDATTNRGCILRVQGRFEEARALFEESLALYRDMGRGIWDVDPLCALAENDIVQGNLISAQARLQEAIPRAKASENKWLQALTAYLGGLLAFHQGEAERSDALLSEATAIARENHFQPDLARSLVAWGRARQAAGEPEQAGALLREGLGRFVRMGHPLGVATALEGLAQLAGVEHGERAARLWSAAEAIRQSLGAPLPPVDGPARDRQLRALQERLGAAAFVAAWAEGRAQGAHAAAEEAAP